MLVQVLAIVVEREESLFLGTVESSMSKLMTLIKLSGLYNKAKGHERRRGSAGRKGL